MSSFEKLFPIGITRIYPYKAYGRDTMHRSGLPDSRQKERTPQSSILNEIFDCGGEVGYWIKIGRKTEKDIVIEFTFHTNRGTDFDKKETFYALCGDSIKIGRGSTIKVGEWQSDRKIKLRFSIR